MSFTLREQLGICGIAFANAIFIYPFLKQFYRRQYSVNAIATHYVRQLEIIRVQAYFDIEVDGKETGRINFELYGEDAPKTVNNFLAFCSGDYSNYLRYRDSLLFKMIPGKYIKGGDITMSDGTGNTTVYDEELFDNEKNKLKFKEPYLLAASANSEGKVGSQFFITLDALPSLNGSDHTIFGRVITGQEAIHMIEGIDEFKIKRAFYEAQDPREVQPSKMFVMNAGVYKFEEADIERQKKSAAGVLDFTPEQFNESRKKKE